MDGILCANFGYQPFGLETCLECWCPTCYRSPTIVDFWVWRRRDPVTGQEVVDEGDERRYQEARPGDAMICPFECDACAFQRLEGCRPSWKAPHEKHLGAFLRQANLDAFWSREPSTVMQNMREFRKQANIGKKYGFVAFDPIGPFPPYYDSGMRGAIGVLMKSVEDGRHEARMKFSAARKGRSIHTNVFKASARGYELSLFGRTDKRRSILSKNPTGTEFYTLFKKGMEQRVGQRVKRDQALSIDILVDMQGYFEELWTEAEQDNQWTEMKRLAEGMTYFLLTYCHSLRGWETAKAVLSETRSQIVDGTGSSNETSHIGLVLYGRFKGCGNSNEFLLCLMSGTTQSGLFYPLKWLMRLLGEMDRVGPSSDWLFQIQMVVGKQ